MVHAFIYTKIHTYTHTYTHIHTHTHTYIYTHIHTHTHLHTYTHTADLAKPKAVAHGSGLASHRRSLSSPNASCVFACVDRHRIAMPHDRNNRHDIACNVCTKDHSPCADGPLSLPSPSGISRPLTPSPHTHTHTRTHTHHHHHRHHAHKWQISQLRR